MTVIQSRAESRGRATATLRVGLFGNLGTGNIGNDASMEAVLGYLRSEYPHAQLDVMSGGASQVTDRYGLPAVRMFWYQGGFGAMSIPLKVLGKAVDVIRTASWVRKHDVIIVPGMGVLEASLPLRPWSFPYALFLLSAWGRVFGTKVALVSVGAGAISQRLTRWLFNWAARLASYRSYRNIGSREAMRERGLDVSLDHVYPDLAFGIATPPYDAGDIRNVCVGVMEYRGSNNDRKRAAEIYEAYVASMMSFVRWLVDEGRNVTLLIGDTNGSDDRVVQEIMADLHSSRPGLAESRVVAAQVSSFADVISAIQPATSVVAIRFHNVLAALRLCKPTISIGYSVKHEALMADMGMDGFCPSVYSLDVNQLIEQFTDLENHSALVRQTLTERNAGNEKLLCEQFEELSAVLFGNGEGIDYE